MLKLVTVSNNKELNKFIQYPNKLYASDSLYSPAVFSEEHNLLTSSKYYYINYDYTFYLVYNDKKLVGRFGLIYPKSEVNKDLFFTRFDTVNDIEVSNFIFNHMVDFAKERKLKRVVGPIGFTGYDRRGILCDNFDKPTAYQNNYNYEYYCDYLSKFGFDKHKKLKTYFLELTDTLDPRLDKMESFILNKYKLRLEVPDSPSKGEEMYRQAFMLLNKVNFSFEQSIYYHEIDEKMAKLYAMYLSSSIKPEYIVGAYDENNNLVGFTSFVPDISQAMKKSNGHIGLFTSLRLADAMKGKGLVDMMGMIVDREYQNCGIDGVLFNHLRKTLLNNDVHMIYTHPVLEASFNRNILNGYEFIEQHEYAVYSIKLKYDED